MIVNAFASTTNLKPFCPGQQLELKPQHHWWVKEVTYTSSFPATLPTYSCQEVGGGGGENRENVSRIYQCECTAAHSKTAGNILCSNIKTVNSYNVRCATVNSLSKVPDTNPITSSRVENSAIVVQGHVIELNLSCWEGLRDIWAARQCDARWTVEQQKLQVSSTQILNPLSCDTRSSNVGFFVTHRCILRMTNKLSVRNFCDTYTS